MDLSKLFEILENKKENFDKDLWSSFLKCGDKNVKEQKSSFAEFVSDYLNGKDKKEESKDKTENKGCKKFTSMVFTNSPSIFDVTSGEFDHSAKKKSEKDELIDRLLDENVVEKLSKVSSDDKSIENIFELSSDLLKEFSTIYKNKEKGIYSKKDCEDKIAEARENYFDSLVSKGVIDGEIKEILNGLFSAVNSDIKSDKCESKEKSEERKSTCKGGCSCKKSSQASMEVPAGFKLRVEEEDRVTNIWDNIHSNFYEWFSADEEDFKKFKEDNRSTFNLFNSLFIKRFNKAMKKGVNYTSPIISGDNHRDIGSLLTSIYRCFRTTTDTDAILYDSLKVFHRVGDLLEETFYKAFSEKCYSIIKDAYLFGGSREIQFQECLSRLFCDLFTAISIYDRVEDLAEDEAKRLHQSMAKEIYMMNTLRNALSVIGEEELLLISKKLGSKSSKCEKVFSFKDDIAEEFNDMLLSFVEFNNKTAEIDLSTDDDGEYYEDAFVFAMMNMLCYVLFRDAFDVINPA